jgi:hypothetical protein
MLNRAVVSSALFLGVLLLGGCHDVFVSCDDVNRTESALGVLNEPKFTSGMLLRLNNASKSIERIYTVSLNSNQLSAATPVVDSTSTLSKADFSMTFSDDISAAEQATIHTYIDSNTQLDLSKSSRRDVLDPIGVLNADANAIDRAKQVPAGDVMLFVSGEVMGTSIDIGIQGQSSAQVGVKAVKIGNLSVNVTYQCANSVQQIANNGAPLLWKGLEVAFDTPSNKFTFGNMAYDLKAYNFGPSIVRRPTVRNFYEFSSYLGGPEISMPLHRTSQSASLHCKST